MITLPAPARPAVAAAHPSAKAGPLGPGAGPLLTEYSLPMTLGNDPARRMAQSITIGMSVKWIRRAEQTIGARLAGAEWHLKDPDGKVIDEQWKGNNLAHLARALLEDPQGEVPIDEIGRRMTRRGFLAVTSRHMGLAGQGAWMLDMRDGNGLPHALLYVRPDRLTPEYAGKVLTEWRLDKRPGDPGLPVKLDDLRLVQLEPPDKGVFAPGLVESALTEAHTSGLAERHWSAVLSSGGRLSGILSPKDAPIEDDTIYEQLVRDWRNIVEQPEAARRLQVVRAPVEFTQTVQDAGTLKIIEFMEANRDGLLALWGVPLTILNGQHAGSVGLNGGDSRQYDEAALWQGAINARKVEIEEALQSILDLWKPVMGWAPRLCIEEPEFDDEAPKFDMAKKAESQPLRNVERRKLLGLEPFGDPQLDNMIMMPVQVVALAMAPDEETGQRPPDMGVRLVDNPKAVPQDPGTTAMTTPANMPGPATPGRGAQPPIAKATAIAQDARRFRDTIAERITPRFQGAVHAALVGQRDEIAAAVERNWGVIARHGARDDSQWWREGGIERAIRPAVAGIAEQAAGHISEAFDGRA